MGVKSTSPMLTKPPIKLTKTHIYIYITTPKPELSESHLSVSSSKNLPQVTFTILFSNASIRSESGKANLEGSERTMEGLSL